MTLGMIPGGDIDILPTGGKGWKRKDSFMTLVVNTLKKRFSKEFPEIKVNLSGEKGYAFKEFFPDIIISSHGMVISVIEVETERTIAEERASQWKAITETGTKLTVLVPRELKVKATELLWKKGLAGKGGIGTYELSIALP